jgi:hypothetical protein
VSNWIEAHQALLSHPKTKRLMRSLVATPNETLGILTRLWWFTMEYAPDGDLGDFSAEDIAEAVGWEEDPKVLLAALQDPGPNKKAHGFLDGLMVHDWDQYGGKLYRKREADAERKRAGRTSAIHRTSNGHPTDGAQTAHVEDRTEEDSRREDLPKEEAAAIADAREAAVENGGGGEGETPENGGTEPDRDDPTLWELWEDAALVAALRAEHPRISLDTVFSEYREAALDTTIARPRQFIRAVAQRIQERAGPEAPPDLVRPEMVASLAAMVAEGCRPEDLRAMCVSDAEYAAVLGNCHPVKKAVVT